MQYPLIVTTITDEKAALDVRTILMITEENHTMYKDENGDSKQVPAHVCIHTEKTQLRVKASFKDLLQQIKDIYENINLGI